MEDPNWELKADYAELQDRMRQILILAGGDHDGGFQRHMDIFSRRDEAFNRIATAAEDFRWAGGPSHLAEMRKQLHSIIRYELMMVSQ